MSEVLSVEQQQIAGSTNPQTSSDEQQQIVGRNNPQQDEMSSQQTVSSWHGFKVVGDNIDKNFHPSFSRSDRKTQSPHYFHYYAVLDRLDLSSCSDDIPTTPVDVNKQE